MWYCWVRCMMCIEVWLGEMRGAVWVGVMSSVTGLDLPTTVLPKREAKTELLMSNSTPGYDTCPHLYIYPR